LIRALWERVPPERQRFARFAVVGASGVLVNLGFMALGRLAFFGLDGDLRELLASALGILISIFTNFVLNDLWTWGDRDKGVRRRDFLVRLVAYYIGAGLAAALQFGTFAALYALFELERAAQVGAVHFLYLAQLAGIGVGMVLNYIINNRVVFRDRKEQPPS